jgi:diguanylate cyclase (GGDEF)-like protein
MPKGESGKTSKIRPSTKRTAMPPPASTRERNRAPAAADPPSPRSRSTAMRLAAEVERLEQELAAARRQMAALEALADIDPLTGVHNRRGFERELARSLAYVKRHGTSAALLYVDLDGFKQVNDRHGHSGGDAMLKAVTMVLTRHVRASDLVARLGGDEFAILLWNCGDADAQTKALALEAAIARTTAMHAGTVISVEASVGATLLFPLDRPAETLERADRAMYARKALRYAARAAT